MNGLGKGGKTFLKKSFSLPSPNPIPPFPKTFAFIESLFEKYGWHAGRAAGVPLRSLFSFLGKTLILSGMASSPPRPKKTKVLGGREVGAWGSGDGTFLKKGSLSPPPHS